MCARSPNAAPRRSEARHDMERTPARNADLVTRAVEQARAAGREVATTDQAREILGLASMRPAVA